MMYEYWMIAGGILIFLELMVPGGVVSFLGVASLIVGGLLFYGVLDSLFAAILTWFISSIVLLLGLRGLVMQFFKGDTKVDNVDEDQDLIGAVVEVVDIIHSYKEGRVRFRETTWTARSDEELDVGQKARIVRREGHVLVVQSF